MSRKSQDRFGNTLTYNYSPTTGYLSSITASDGREVDVHLHVGLVAGHSNHHGQGIERSIAHMDLHVRRWAERSSIT